MKIQYYISFANAIRESSLKRLRIVPLGFENWRVSPNALSFADLANHLIETDRWLLEKFRNPGLLSIQATAGSVQIDSREQYDALLENLLISGIRRTEWLSNLGEEQWHEMIPDDRFEGEVTKWWVIVRGNFDHEIHHRGQIATYLRVLKDEGNLLSSC